MMKKGSGISASVEQIETVIRDHRSTLDWIGYNHPEKESAAVACAFVAVEIGIPVRLKDFLDAWERMRFDEMCD